MKLRLKEEHRPGVTQCKNMIRLTLLSGSVETQELRAKIQAIFPVEIIQQAVQELKAENIIEDEPEVK